MQFERGDRRFGRFELGQGFAGGVCVAFTGHLGEDLGFFELVQLSPPALERFGESGPFPQNGLGFFAVVPEIGCGSGGVQFGDLLLACGDVKDASREG